MICAGCEQEFTADGGKPLWECPHCQRSVDNRRYPFLDGSLVEAYINAANEDWRNRHDALLERAHQRVLELEARIATLESDLRTAKGGQPPAPRTGDAAPTAGPARISSQPQRGAVRPTGGPRNDISD